jgi:hypothetical protein
MSRPRLRPGFLRSLDEQERAHPHFDGIVRITTDSESHLSLALNGVVHEHNSDDLVSVLPNHPLGFH